MPRRRSCCSCSGSPEAGTWSGRTTTSSGPPRVRGPALDHRRRSVQGAGLREGGPSGRGLPRGPRRARRRRDPSDPGGRQVDRGEDPRATGTREVPRARIAACPRAVGRPRDDGDPRVRPEEGDGRLPGAWDQRRERAGRRRRAGATSRPQGVLAQGRGKRPRERRARSPSGGRVLVSEALDVAEVLLERIRASRDVRRADFAGSLRRMVETIGDVDLLVASERRRVRSWRPSPRSIWSTACSRTGRRSPRSSRGPGCRLTSASYR